MTNVEDYLAKAKATRQRLIDAGRRYEQDRATQAAAAAEREIQRRLRQAHADRMAGMPPVADAALHDALREVLIAHDTTWANIVSQARGQRHMPPRQDVYAVLRRRGWSYPAIARFCGRACHTSIMYALEERQYRLEREARVARIAE